MESCDRTATGLDRGGAGKPPPSFASKAATSKRSGRSSRKSPMRVRPRPVVSLRVACPMPPKRAAQILATVARAVLGLNTAPDVLGWLLFWTDDWSADSEWYEWPLRP